MLETCATLNNYMRRNGKLVNLKHNIRSTWSRSERNSRKVWHEYTWNLSLLRTNKGILKTWKRQEWLANSTTKIPNSKNCFTTAFTAATTEMKRLQKWSWSKKTKQDELVDKLAENLDILNKIMRELVKITTCLSLER